jgi:hypothetical protein
MRTRLLVGAISLLVTYAVAHGQSGPAAGKRQDAPSSATAKPDGTMSEAEIQKLGAQYLSDCIKDWDKGTHMSKQDWARTCRRVVQRRVRFLMQQEK